MCNITNGRDGSEIHKFLPFVVVVEFTPNSNALSEVNFLITNHNDLGGVHVLATLERRVTATVAGIKSFWHVL